MVPNEFGFHFMSKLKSICFFLAIICSLAFSGLARSDSGKYELSLSPTKESKTKKLDRS